MPPSVSVPDCTDKPSAAIVPPLGWMMRYNLEMRHLLSEAEREALYEATLEAMAGTMASVVPADADD